MDTRLTLQVANFSLFKGGGGGVRFDVFLHVHHVAY